MQQIRPILFFFNPNIFPESEYEIRKKELLRHAQSLKLELIDGDYDHVQWLKNIKGLENQPEKGLRCLECFKIRLLATARLAYEKKISQITTTLTSSRWKSFNQITEAGNWAVSHFPTVEFWHKNWRKDGLSERRRILLQKNEFYNQTYCGCEYSIKKIQEANIR
jgi:predicted adenine nucleotide alpha hydrolase (AANH) superfamily ATPase